MTHPVGDGAKYKNNFIWDGELACGEPAPPILASKFNVGFYKVRGKLGVEGREGGSISMLQVLQGWRGVGALDQIYNCLLLVRRVRGAHSC